MYVSKNLFGSVCTCVYLVDYILPVLDEGESAAAAVCVLGKVEGSCSAPQIQFPQCFSDCYLRLGTAVQILQHIITLT